MSNCKKCKKDIPDDFTFCPYCGKKQITTPKKRNRKRAHKTGSIKQDKRYKNPYLAYAPADMVTGERRYIGAFPDVAAAQKAIEEFSNCGILSKNDIKFSEIYSMWSKAYFPNIGESQQASYRTAYKHFKPLYNAKIADIRTEHMQAVINTATSKSSADKRRTLVQQIFRYALQNDYVNKDYSEFLTVPKYEKSEKVIFSDQQISSLWEHTEDIRVQVILVMIYMGFRIGEIVGLKFSDIHEQYVIAGEKTEAGQNRIIPFPSAIPEIRQFVMSWYVDEKKPDIFQSTDTLRLAFYFALKDIGFLPDFEYKRGYYIFQSGNHLTPHSTRHTFASLSARAGMKPENLQKIIGHANYQTTADVYVHEYVDDLISEMNKLQK